MDHFTYDAPDYFLDFSKDLETEDIKKAEAFFKTEHKSHFGVQIETSLPQNDSEREIEQEFYTPMKEAPTFRESENAEKYPRNNLRKSLSMNSILTTEFEHKKPNDDITTISDAMENLRMSAKKSKLTKSSRKSHVMVTRADKPKLNLRTRSVSRDHLEKLSQPKRKNVSHEDLQATKYISMAEAINQFQQKTPMRFHSKSKNNFVSTAKMHGPKPTTIPQSPALATKQRARVTQVMSREELELKEFEDAKRYKIKANPLNPKILKGPVPVKAAVRKITHPEPFKLTEVPIKKPPTPTKSLFEFHAKPVPKSVLEPPAPIIKSALFTNPCTPNLMKRYQRAEPKNEAISETKVGQPFKVLQTKIQPFSFEQRDKEMMKKREQLVLEEEKKAREFHARPVPKSIFKSPQAKNHTFYYQKRQKSDGSIYKSTEDMSAETPSLFKARPATVLQMKPFEPKKDEQHHIEIEEFQLSTYYRAKQREEFELKKKEREEKMALLMKQKEEEHLQHEKEEKLKIRKETMIKAQPIRRYKEVPTVPTKKLTAPISPNFKHDKIKKEHLIINKENLMNNSNTNAL